MAKKSAKKKTKKTRSKKQRSTFFSFLRKMLLLAVGVGLVAGVATLVWLDGLVQERFDSHQWELPARVYASPVELYRGRVLSMSQLKQLLMYMHYREEAGAPRPGTHQVQGNRVLIHTRGFSDSDGGETPQKLRITIAGERIDGLQDSNGNSVPVARLEPLHIGSIHPGHEQDRILQRLDETPALLVDLLLATEDRAFYEHHGISFRGLARAMAANIKQGGFRQGGSTLTQQLVKNFWLSRDRTIARKLLEMPMAVLLERHYEKDQILETYLNEVYLGQDGNRAVHGMGLASFFYFGLPLEELAPQHMALLVGMLKGPGLYNPKRFPERATERRNVVLTVAEQHGILSAEEADKARNAPLGIVEKGEAVLYAFPDFIDLVKRQLARDYQEEALSNEGLIIHSTLDVLAQLAAENAATSILNDKDPSAQRKLEVGVVLTAPDQGDVLAVVGSRRPRTMGFNRALDAKRPIGSLAKPAVLLTALTDPKKYHLGSLVDDAPITVNLPNGKTWSPKNADNKSLGPITLTDMLALSRNQATVRLGMEVGPNKVNQTLQQLGMRTKIHSNPSLLLGGFDLTPFEVADVYQPLATGGFQTALRSITDVLDAEGQPVARYPVDPKLVYAPEPVFLVQWAMMQVMQKGTGRGALSVMPAQIQTAGKTGTSSGLRDAWFAGFSGNHLAVVWVGRDDNQPAGVGGSSYALPIWAQLMAAVPQRTLRDIEPGGVYWQWWDATNGQAYTESCGNAVRYPMLEKTNLGVEATRCNIRSGIIEGWESRGSESGASPNRQGTEEGGLRGWWQKHFGR
ncbi:MAG TPA: penicillin-binding protein 1B [Alcanivoracaceae bacterium]|nr:penicillin-binding protein 1B [Alcanivoracaceae bacterium]